MRTHSLYLKNLDLRQNCIIQYCFRRMAMVAGIVDSVAVIDDSISLSVKNAYK